jgi:hypothetical protein
MTLPFPLRIGSICPPKHSLKRTITYLVDHILKLGLGGVLTQRSHNGTKLLGCDSSITIYIISSFLVYTKEGLTLVKEGECLLEL